MAGERRPPSSERQADIEIGATVRAKEVRFDEQPESRIEFRGRWIAEQESGSERENLPDEVEPGVTYHDVRVGWRAAAWLENPDEPDEDPGSDT